MIVMARVLDWIFGRSGEPNGNMSYPATKVRNLLFFLRVVT